MTKKERKMEKNRKKATHDRADKRIKQMVRFLIRCHWKEVLLHVKGLMSFLFTSF